MKFRLLNKVMCPASQQKESADRPKEIETPQWGIKMTTSNTFIHAYPIPLDDDGSEIEAFAELIQPSNKRTGRFRRSSSLADLDLIQVPEPVEVLRKSKSSICTDWKEITPDSPVSQSTISTFHTDSREFVAGSLSSESTTDDSSHGNKSPSVDSCHIMSDIQRQDPEPQVCQEAQMMYFFI